MPINREMRIDAMIDLMSTLFLNKKYPVKKTGCNIIYTMNSSFMKTILLITEVNSFNSVSPITDMIELNTQIVPQHRIGIKITYFRYKCINFSKTETGKVKSNIELYLFNGFSNKQGETASINIVRDTTKLPYRLCLS